MDENQLNEKLSQLIWGTGMPIIVITAAGMSQVRCRGRYSMEVKNLEKLQAKLPEVEQTASWVGSLIVTKIADSINEIAPGLTSAQQLASKLVDIGKTVKDGVTKTIDDAGLVMNNFTIDAMDILP